MANVLLRFHQPGADAQPETTRAGGLAWRTFAGFWLLGLLNNSSYVIMIAGANEIDASAVGLVFLAAIAPTALVKLSAPYWFHLVSYTRRFTAAAALMAASFAIVGLSSNTSTQLFGVALIAIQGGLGEASALGLCSLAPQQLSLTAWSSGTGFAGIFGYGYLITLHTWLGVSYTATLLAALGMPVAWLAVFHWLRSHSAAASRSKAASARGRYSVVPPDDEAADMLLALAGSRRSSSHGGNSSRGGSSNGGCSPSIQLSTCGSAPSPDVNEHQQQQRPGSSCSPHAGPQQEDPADDPGARLAAAESGAGAAAPNQHSRSGAVDVSSMTALQRLRAVAALWPYTVPLFVVYFAEYAMQSGTWTAIGFPVTDPRARHAFYSYSNWLYQCGVFLSRSSGLLFQANRAVLWAMPALQVCLLAVFTLDAATHWWWSWGLLAPCFAAGLLGGATYVNAFTLLTHEVEEGRREFSLAAACVADSLGIAAADVAGVLLQGCLFRLQGLPGAAFKCRWR